MSAPPMVSVSVFFVDIHFGRIIPFAANTALPPIRMAGSLEGAHPLVKKKMISLVLADHQVLRSVIGLVLVDVVGTGTRR